MSAHLGHRFSEPHDFLLDENGVTDAETLTFVKDAMAVNASLYQGVPIGPWIEACLM